MNRLDLFTEVASWLKAADFPFTAEEGRAFRLRVMSDHAWHEVRLLCEEDPAMLQAFCPVALRIPQPQVFATAAYLHTLNTKLRIGAFQFHVAERVIEFRLAMPIHPEAPLTEQFDLTIGTTLATVDEHIQALTLLACDTAEARAEVASLQPRAEAALHSLQLSGTRVDRN